MPIDLMNADPLEWTLLGINTLNFLISFALFAISISDRGWIMAIGENGVYDRAARRNIRQAGFRLVSQIALFLFIFRAMVLPTIAPASGIAGLLPRSTESVGFVIAVTFVASIWDMVERFHIMDRAGKATRT